MIIADETTFPGIVESATSPVLVYFWATWCGPCRVLGPTLEKIEAESADQLTIVKVDADQNPGLAARYSVLGLPTMKLLVDGRVDRTIVGAKPRAALEAELRSALAA